MYKIEPVARTMSEPKDDLVERLYASDAASALTNEAGRYIEAQAKLIEGLVEVASFAERKLQEIYIGDEGPVVLNTVRAKCARRHEAGQALRGLTTLLASIKEPTRADKV